MALEQDNLQKFKDAIFKALKSDKRVWDDEGELDQIKLIDLAVKLDEEIIDLLYKNKEIRNEFFIKVKDVFVFKLNEFQFFLEENKIDNSFTAYKNLIGLTDGKKFIKDTNDVVLDFPYKDCILEGGQSNEEGYDNCVESKDGDYEIAQAKRKEIFYNSTIAHDEIDRLLAPKAFVNWKRYNKDGEQKVGEIKRGDDGTITENMIIKGNNLLALHSLKEQFAGKVKLIYIDPPYNNGDDDFKYNDSFKHSTWLTFMKNRLEITKELLKDDGVIFVQIDNSPSSMDESPEFGYLYVLMDEIFGRKNYLTTLVWKKKGNPSNTEDNIGTITESVLVYAKAIEQVSVNLQEYKRVYKFIDKKGKKYNRDNILKTNKGKYKRDTMLFPIDVKEGSFSPPQGKRWTMGTDAIQEYIDQGKYEICDGKFFLKKYPEDYMRGEHKLHSNLLDAHGSLKTAKGEIEELGFNREIFDSPKPEILIKRIIEMASNEKDIVLDYYLGSGTTCAVAHKMGRHYIGVEQMDYIEDIAVSRMQKVIKGEKGGISDAVNWKGGGEFIYCELAKCNEQAKEEIKACKNLKELTSLLDDFCNKYFLHYNVQIKKFRDEIIKEEGFKNLSIERQKEIFTAMLDNNQLYVHASEAEDSRFKISKDDQSLSKEFYNHE